MKKTKLTKKSKGSYFSLEIDKKGIVFLSIMMFITAGIIFYLGVIFGKAMRDPNTLPLDLAGSATDTGNQGSEKKIGKNLKIYDIRDKESGTAEQDRFSNFKQDLLKKNQEADQMINSSKNFLGESKADNQAKQAVLQTIEQSEKSGLVVKTPKKPFVETPPKTIVEIPAKPAATAPITIKKKWPKTGLTSNRIYTIQIIATKNRERADRLRNQLKDKNFNAYVTEIELQGTKVYRVRVGKRNKDEIQQLKARLSTSVKGLGKLVVFPLF